MPTIWGTPDNDILNGTSAADDIHGLSGDDTIVAGDGDDILDGGDGADNLQGGLGNDTYYIDELDIVTEAFGEGYDEVVASFSYVLGANFEDLFLTGDADVNGAGNDLINNLRGNAGNNVLQGFGNRDYLYGLEGDDSLYGGDGDYDVVNGGPGNDLLDGGAGVHDTASYYYLATGGVAVDLSISGPQDTRNAGVDTLVGIEDLEGTDFSDLLTGNDDPNIIWGGAGVDTLIGLGGDDGYFVDDFRDVVIEAPNGGTDEVQSFGSYNLPDNVENLRLYALTPGAVTGHGNALANDIFGSVDQPNFLYGGGGDDRLYGGQNADGLIGEDGNDTLYGALGDDALAGNAGADSLFGEEGNDLLDGGSGDDILNGSIGTDRASYLTASSGVVVSLAQTGPQNTFGAGVDTLISIESLTGSPFADTLSGNSGDNVITGAGGVDVLSGGAGNDTFLDTAAGLDGDTITDFGPNDKIVIADATLAGFTFNLTGNTLTFTGGSLTLSNVPKGTVVAAAAAGGGVQLTLKPSHDPASDFNGDGKSDVLLRHDSGLLTDWLGQSNGTFASNQGVGAYNLSTSWHAVATGDFNGDGRDDVLLRHDNGLMTDWLGQSNGTFASNQSIAAYRLDLSWHVVGTGDINGDGRDDLVLRNDSGLLTEWLGQSNGTFASNQGVAAYNLSNAWTVIGTGDFNGDGRADILIRQANGVMTDWLGQANGGFASNQSVATYNLTTAWHVVGTGDINGDGRDDLVLRHDNGLLTEWLGQANGGFASNQGVATYNLATSWHVQAVGDYNGDGRDDILLRNDSGLLTDWLGQANGGFASNQGIAAYNLSNTWHTQPVHADWIV